MAFDNISQDTAAFDLSDGNGNRIAWDPVTATLEVQGVIKRETDLLIEYKNNPSNTITYVGTGTIYAKQLLSIRADLVPAGQYVDGDSLGLVTADTLHLGLKDNGDPPKIMAAAYAKNKAVVDAGTHFAGTLVCGYVDFDGSAGTLVHVPKVGLNPPPGLPGTSTGGYTVIQIKTLDWYQQR